MNDLQPQDNAFFEEYKHLEKLCSEVFFCRSGVSEYITQMENDSYPGSVYVPSWEADYKALKRIRWVRNRIAHDDGMCQISMPEDLAFAKAFSERILSCSDPLAQLRQAEKAEAERRRAQKKQQNKQEPDYIPRCTNTYSAQAPAKHRSKTRIWIFLAAGIAALAAMVLLLVFL